MPFQARDITIPPVPDWLQRGAGAITQYIPDIFAPGDPYLPGTMLLPEYMKDWAQGETVDPSEMMYESLTNQMGGGQPLAQIAERSGTKNLGAFLHRAIDPEEFKFLDWLAKKGKQSEAAASVITPTYRSIFHPSLPSPGVVFSVRNPENIRWWSPQDAWSRSTMIPQPERQRALNQIDKIMAKLQPDIPPINPLTQAEAEKLSRYLEARFTVGGLPTIKKVTPGGYNVGYPHSKLPSSSFIDESRGSWATLKGILGAQEDRLRWLAEQDPNMTSTPYYKLLNEVGYRMDPREIVGVRIPRNPNALEAASTTHFSDPMGVPPDELLEPAIDFAKRHNLPVWQFSPQLTPGEAAAGISEYLTPGSTAARFAKKKESEWADWFKELGLNREKALKENPLLAETYQLPVEIPDWLKGMEKAQWYRRTTEEFPMGLVESTADPLAKYYGIELPAVNPFMYME